MITRILLATGVLVASLLVGIPDAFAISAYCQDQVQPVSISTQRLDSSHVRVGATAPINSVAYYYAEDNGANAHSAWASRQQNTGGVTYATITATLPHRYWIANVADNGQRWYGPGNVTLPSCHSPIRYQA